MSPVRRALPVVLVLGLALVLRVWGIDFGLPYAYHGDEGFEVDRALSLGAGVFELGRIGKGAYYYLLFVLYGVYYVVERVAGGLADSQEFLYSTFVDRTPIWLIGRYTTAIIGVVNCYVLYLLGRRTHSVPAGLFAALLMAVNVLHVASSHYITVDVPLTTVVTVGLLLMYWRPLDQPASTLRYGLIGASVGLATATKLPGALLILPALVFHYNQFRIGNTSLVRGWLGDRKLWTLLATGGILYVALEPGIVLYLDNVVAMVGRFFIPSRGGGLEPNWPVPARAEGVVAFYLRGLIPWAYVMVTVPVVVGCLVSLRQRPLRHHLGLIFAVAFGILLVASPRPDMVFTRYLLPLTPVVWLYAGWGAAEIGRALSRQSAWLRYGALGAVVILSAGPMVLDSIRYDEQRTWPDTRTIAKEWIDEHVPPGAVIHIGGSVVVPSTLTAPLKISPELVDGLIAQAAGVPPSEASTQKDMYYETYKRHLRTQKTYHLILSGNDEQLRAALEEGRGDYVLLEERVERAFDSEFNREWFPLRWQLIQWTKSNEFELVQQFRPARGITGSALSLYKRVGRG